MSYENYDDVRSQLMDAGLMLDGELRVGGGRSQRCRVEGRSREKRGWYWLHDAQIDGRLYLIGAFGVYEGNDPGTQKIKLTKRCDGCHNEVSFKEKKCPHCQTKLVTRELTDGQRAAHRARIAESEKIEKARRQAEAARAARIADRAWQQCSTTGDCEYLNRKGITGSHGARYTKRGNLVIPMLDTIGRVHGLQVIYGDPKIKARKGRDKDYWPTGVEKAGHFYMVGTPGPVILLCEGFATGCSILEATTGMAVVVAFDANNLMPVAQVLHKRWPRSKILICADDDYATRIRFGDDGIPEMNPGVTLAKLSALAVGGAVVAPTFALDTARPDIAAQVDFKANDYKAQVGRVLAGRPKLTDFNDLHATEGLHLVGAQINAVLDNLGWRSAIAPRQTTETGEGGRKLAPITSSQELHERFAIIYGHNKALFDFRERMLVSVDDMKLACSGREIWRDWTESQEKKIVRIKEVGFDPTETDKTITCNLWGGWPTVRRAGNCERLLELLEYLCCGEKQNTREIYEWVLNWIAYPIQHPGAKMQTALVLHGPQGAGKNMIFESVMRMYGEYGTIVNQTAIDDKHNEWASKKLFIIANEVVSRQEIYHSKNLIKNMITDPVIRINPKHVGGYYETNHTNIVFLSNETQPINIEPDDRRFAVIWTPPSLSESLYMDVAAEIDAGGIEALHDFLYNRDLGKFGPHSKPPKTAAKDDLIDISLDSTHRFGMDWVNKRIEHIPVVPTKSTDLYAFYRLWCTAIGVRAAPAPRFLAEITKRIGARKGNFRYSIGVETPQARFVFPPGIEQPVDKNQPIWLSDCIGEFSEGVNTWRNEMKM